MDTNAPSQERSRPDPGLPPLPPPLTGRRRPPRPFEMPPIETIFKWTGVVLVFLAVAFAMGVAIDRGWLTPAMRVAGGLALGAGFLGAGLRIHSSRPVFGQTVEGAGLAIGYMSFYAGHQLFGVFTYPISFTGMLAITTLAFVLAFRQSDSALAVIGFLGGLVTPLILADGGPSGVGGGTGDSLVGLAAYTGLLVAATIAVYLKEGWGSLMGASVVGGSAVVILMWSLAGHAGPYTPDRLAIQLIIVLVTAGWWLATVWRSRSGLSVAVADHSIDNLLRPLFEYVELRAVLVLPLWGLVLSYALWRPDDLVIGGATLAVAVLVALVGFVVRGRGEPVLETTHYVSAAITGAGGLALVLSGPVLFVVMAAYVLALILAAELVDSPVFGAVAYTGGFAVLSVLVVRLLIGVTGISPITAGDLAADLTVILMTLGVAAFVAMPTDVRAAVGGLGYLAGLAWFYEAFQGVPDGQAAISAGWATLGAAALVGAAMVKSGSMDDRRARKSVAVTGLVTIGVVIVKLFLVDLAGVDVLWRIGLFLGTGGLLLVLAYFFPTLWRRIEGEDPAVTAPPA